VALLLLEIMGERIELTSSGSAGSMLSGDGAAWDPPESVLREVLGNPFNQEALRGLVEEALVAPTGTLSTEELGGHLREQLQRGTLQFRFKGPRKPEPLGPEHPQQQNETPVGPGGDDDLETHWVEIELVDEDDKPVNGARYEVKLPDGTTRTGTLPRSGVVRLTSSKPGTCEVVFPELDKDAWKSA